MERIPSFSVNHMTLKPGIYISRIDDDIVTYDIRMKKPNSGDYLKNESIHTIEHIFATFVRNSGYSNNIIYFGPMGCRTGFYFIVRNLEPEIVIELIKNAFEYIADFYGDIPGVSAAECGNYIEHDLLICKADAREMLKIVTNYTSEKLKY